MASFNQPKGRIRGNSEWTRGNGNRALGRGKGGRGGRLGRHGRGRGDKKASFNSTRVDEEHRSDSDQSEKASEVDAELEFGSDGLSSDEEDGAAAASVVKPYSALLQSLNDSIQHEEPPQQKRRKIEFEVSGKIDVVEDVDLVIEPEEAEDLGIGELTDEYGNDEAEGGHDPFISQFANPDESEIARMIDDVKHNRWLLNKSAKDSEWPSSLKAPAGSKVSNFSEMEILQGTQSILLKQRLKTPAVRLLPAFDQLTGSLASNICGYRDVLFSSRTPGYADYLRKLACLHSLNHVFKTRDKIIKNNAVFAGETIDEDIELRDQGFTRPKVLIILPTRQSCAKYVNTIISLAEPEQQENKKRFQDTYTQGADDFSDDKPEDFRELFGGNDDDMFRLGLKFTRKTIKYFSQFYNSDIIFASPLGLRMALGAETSKQQDHDFLSSIEIVIVDQCDALAMQNWEHVEYIFDHLNLQPKEAHGCDFSRVRNWYLDGNAKYLRQTILFSSFTFPSVNKLYVRNMLNITGKIKYNKTYDGAMLDLGFQVKQSFARYNTTTPSTDPDDRFGFFTTAVIPSLTKNVKANHGNKQGILIYLPLYADFVRVRNYLATSSNTQNISFGSISEYTNLQDVTRARSHFFSGRHSILLYTERAHHFRRYCLKGVKSIIMYGLPENPLFYKEIVGGYLGFSVSGANMDPNIASVRSLFSRLDILKLERIVGTKRSALLINDKNGDTFDFV
ncbi:rRNA-binding ribosome biosynthesis protein utp25 [Lobaria immixta]|nr:rRNA-binding ribosome biosynthesis protein utp25 [Lobaria immixta]